MAPHNLWRKPHYAELNAFATVLNYVDRSVTDHHSFRHLNRNLTVCSFHLIACLIFTNSIYRFTADYESHFLGNPRFFWQSYHYGVMESRFTSVTRNFQTIWNLIFSYRKLSDKFEKSKKERKRSDIYMI